MSATPIPIGIAAGVYKEAQHCPMDLLTLASHITYGSYTLFPKRGNPEPNVDFNGDTGTGGNCIKLKNKGLRSLLTEELATLEKRHANTDAKLGISLAPSKPREAHEIVSCIQDHISEHGTSVDFWEFNVSCPNDGTYDSGTLAQVMFECSTLRATKSLKIAPCNDIESLRAIVDLCGVYNFSILVSGNTLKGHFSEYGLKRLSATEGGISGRPLFDHTRRQVTVLRNLIDKRNPGLHLRGCGGIQTVKDVQIMQEAGADTLEVASLLYFKPERVFYDLVLHAAFASTQ